MKMRVLYSTNKGKIKTIAQLITDKYATEKVNCMDSIPPAYSCVGRLRANGPVWR